MAMGVLSDSDFFKELDNVSREIKVQEIKSPQKDGPIIEILPSPGRSKNDVNVPDSLRKVIASTAIDEGHREATEFGRMLGVSPSSVSAYSKGATSTASYDQPKKSILDHINRHKERITKKAHAKLSLAIDAITEEKLSEVKARDLAGIAKDMSVVIKNMEPDVKSIQENDKPVFILYKPELKQENHYDTIKLPE